MRVGVAVGDTSVPSRGRLVTQALRRRRSRPDSAATDGRRPPTDRRKLSGLSDLPRPGHDPANPVRPRLPRPLSGTESASIARLSALQTSHSQQRRNRSVAERFQS